MHTCAVSPADTPYREPGSSASCPGGRASRFVGSLRMGGREDELASYYAVFQRSQAAAAMHQLYVAARASSCI